jgi:carbon-monoxide dehydrogenase medium subunit
MYISDFNYHKPLSIQEACTILADSPDGAPLAGGTDLLVEMKQGLRHHQDIVSLTAIGELKSIYQEEANLFIGAGVTHSEVMASPLIKELFPAITEAASTIGTDQVRNTGTIGGNLCTAASCSDMAPILMALKASVEIHGPAETRTVPLVDLFVFHKETRIQKGEIITKIIVPLAKAGTGACFEKFGLREAASISVASAAVAIIVDNGLCADARVVIGAVAPTPKISTSANEVLIGKKVAELSEDSSSLKQVGEAAAADSLPLDDIRGTADYRRDLIKVLTQRAVIKALSRASR